MKGRITVDISVQALRAKVDLFLEKKAEIKELDQKLKDLHRDLLPIQKDLNQIMEAMDLDRFEGSAGKITRVKIDYVSNPVDDQRELFLDYLKSEGIFDEMVSVHHQKLNSFYKDRLNQAIEDGVELNIPGLEPKQRIEIRKTR